MRGGDLCPLPSSGARKTRGELLPAIGVPYGDPAGHAIDDSYVHTENLLPTNRKRYRP